MSPFPVRRIIGILAPLALASSMGFAQAPPALRWDELTSAALARLDRARTVVLAPAGIVEAHGTLLPNGTEVVINERIAVELADSIAARTGWAVVILPTIPLGAGAFDRRGGQGGVGGTLSVRAATVQAVFSDIADNLGQQGFRFVFVVSGHADANHDRALDLAGEHFAASFRGTMVHLLGRRGCHADDLGPPPITLFSAAAMTADADSPNGGTLETSRAMWVRPDLVDTVAVRRASDVTIIGAAGASRPRARGEWPGFVGAPRFATLELGAWLFATQLRACTSLAIRLLDGLDERTVLRIADQRRADPARRAELDADARREAGEGPGRRRDAAPAPTRP